MNFESLTGKQFQIERPLTERPDDCRTCINEKHPENCRRHCPVLIKNKGSVKARK